MYDAIQNINYEQLVTPTDRLLVGKGRTRPPTSPTGVPRPQQFPRGSSPDFDFERTIHQRTEVPGRAWALVKQPLAIVCLLLAIAVIVYAAAIVAGNAAAGAVAISGALGGIIGGVLAQREVRRARV
jgi:hypothetical protein